MRKVTCDWVGVVYKYVRLELDKVFISFMDFAKVGKNMLSQFVLSRYGYVSWLPLLGFALPYMAC